MKYCVKQSDKLVLKTNNLFQALQVATKNNTYTVFSQDEAIYQNDGRIYAFSHNGFNFKVDSNTKRYCDLPIFIYPNSQKPSHLEYHTGAYNYIYSKPGYEQIEVIIDTKDIQYQLPKDNSKWAPYIIINHQIVDQIDVGLYVDVVEDHLELRPFYFYMGGSHPKEFKVHNDSIVSLPISHSDQNQSRQIKIVLKAIPIGWHVNFTNLENQKTIEYTYQFIQPNDVKPINRFLIGVSLCPVGETIWDPTSSAAFSGVRFIRCILNDDHIFSPNSELMSEGYA